MIGQFVFVTNEKTPISRSSLSAINSQVAKYSHARRQRKSTDISRYNRRCQSRDMCILNGKVAEPADLSTPSNGFYVPRSQPTLPLPLSHVHDSEGEITDPCHSVYSDTDRVTNVASNVRLPDELFPLHVYPSDLDVSEQALMHYWFTQVFPGDFSTSLQLDGFMGPLSRYPIAFSVPLRWAVAKATERLMGTKTVESAKFIFRNQRKAIEQLRAVLNSSQTSLDELLASVIYSIVKNDGKEQMHLNGLDTLIHARGGLSTVLKATRIVRPEHIVHMYTFIPFEVKSYTELLSLKTILLTTITYIQNGMKSVLLASAHDAKLREFYLVEQRNFLSESTVIGQHIRSELEIGGAYCWKARQFCALLTLSISLLSLDLQGHRTDFLKKLEWDAGKIASIDSSTGRFRIRSGALVFMIGHVYEETLAGNTHYLSKATRITEAAVASLKLFGLLSKEYQLKLFQLLQRGLILLSGSDKTPEQIQSYCLDFWDEFEDFAVSQEVDEWWIRRKMSLTEYPNISQTTRKDSTAGEHQKS